MSDVMGAQGAEVETTNEAAAEAALSSQEPAERDWEKEARADGWVPEAEFKGAKKPTKFLSAEEFVKRGEEFAPFIHKSRAELAEEIKTLRESTVRMTRVFEQSLERERSRSQKEIDTLKAQRLEAVKAADVEAVQKLDGQIEEASRTAVPGDVRYADMTSEQKQKIDTASQQEWQKANPWYGVDHDLTDVAIGYSTRIARPDLPLAENLAQVETYLRQKFPEKFGMTTNKAANGHAAVDGGGSFNGSAPKEIKLSAAEKEAGNMLIRQGVYKDLKEYARDLHGG